MGGTCHLRRPQTSSYVVTDTIAPTGGSLFRVIAPISAGHFLSHFYMLLLPPLFPLLRDVYGVGFTELGFAITVFSVFAVATEAPLGFLVDRFGATGILVSGIVVHSIAVAAIGVFPTYAALLVIMAFMGVASAVYHPADYSILNACVKPSFMGRAFSIHTATGFLGQAVAPVTMIGLMAFVDWRTAIILCGVSGLFFALLIHLNVGRIKAAARTPQSTSANKTKTGWSLLFSLPIVMALLFYAGIAMSGQGISGFSVSSLHLIYGASISDLAIVLSAYLFAAPVGVLFGGWLADRTSRHELNVAICFCTSAAAIIAVAALELDLVSITLLFVVAGLCVGIVAPSRDMLIRSITPPGDVGKVFGFVSSGFHLGGTVGPVTFGYLLDTGEPRSVFWAVGGLWLVTIATVMITGHVGRTRTQ